ncbi:lysine--tRNA ligase [Candidatus Nomurabacteria bacterium RIFCSPHIGHO2_01_FULL_42_16]|uniref:Lysine--tRNA ligase n=1 Tax=Candidatus Nomurabacteria bacterium RIFCSPHIGHO2_01_FULL_42_16 TaxID=1801743 RepID=A0A1F6VK27_9BACT|nr:MAG: lysine--tRNA ligase [Candidatus Nomurabacteria bacterium RIFCSPHIGHO2_01_FULL_42_16]
MSSIEEIRKVRLEKLEALRKNGIDPYPIDSNQEFTLEEVFNNFSKLSKRKKSISVVGRVMSLRPQGGLVFLHLNDGTISFQVLIKKDDPPAGGGEEAFKLFNDTVDIGDFLEIKGTLFVTKRKEKTLLAKKWRMLSKSLRPLPEKWHGLQDVEERFRKRYLDALMNKEVRDRFILRSRIIAELRNILDDAGYLEFETPVLQPLYGGASALPFKTHHKTLDLDMYLRISDELYLKRLLIAGFPKVYEISKDFRNEGIDATHNPEFTMLEYYESYSDAEKQMIFLEKTLKTLIKKVLGKIKINFASNVIDFGKKFAVISYFDLLRRHAIIPNPETISKEELIIVAHKFGVLFGSQDSFDKILDNVFKKVCRPKIIQPTFIIDYPATYLPLAKRKPENEMLVSAFQMVAGGMELVKAFSELNDPIDQRSRFMHQEKTKEEGEQEAQVLDEDFLEAMEYGMPPSGGVGIGIDRLIMLLTDTHNIKEVIFFPVMRPKS